MRVSGPSLPVIMASKSSENLVRQTRAIRTWGCLENPPFFATNKTLALIYFLELKSNGVSMYKGERVVFSCRLPQDRWRSILGQRGMHTSAHPG